MKKERNLTMMNNGLVSVVVPVYNSEKYLKKCLDSIFSQTYSLLEVICINDGSTDSSFKILEQFKQIFGNKMIIKSIENAGQANARNLGMEIASGEYICFVDSDDSLKENMLEKMVAQLQLCDCDFVFCNIDRIVEGKMNILERRFKYDTALEFSGVTTIYDHPEIICYITVAPFAKLIKRAFLDKNNIRFIKGYIYEDLVFTQMMLAANPRICMLKDKLYNYLIRNNSTMTSKNSKVLDMFKAYENLYNEYDKWGLTIDFKKELDYLCLYHVMIGTSYRMWRSTQFKLTESLAMTRDYCKSYHCNKKNDYVNCKGLLIRLFIKLLYR